MSKSSHIPSNYSEWLECITHCFEIPLTEEFAQSGIESLSNMKSEISKALIRKYGKEYHGLVLSWFRRALFELNKN